MAEVYIEKEGGKMRRLKYVKASTLIETIVASIIMLVAFGAAMHTATQLTVSKDDCYTLIEADYRVKACLAEYADGEHHSGTYYKEYDWGKITIRVSQYRDYDYLQQIVVFAAISRSFKHIERRHIIKMKR